MAKYPLPVNRINLAEIARLPVALMAAAHCSNGYDGAFVLWAIEEGPDGRILVSDSRSPAGRPRAWVDPGSISCRIY